MPSEAFSQFAAEVFRLYGSKAYAQALALVESTSVRFPERWGELAYWRLCFLSLLGRDHELNVMREAVESGYWWSETLLHGDSDLRTLRGLPEFERLVAVCRERHAAAQAVSKPELVLIRTTETMPRLPRLIIALYGAGGNAPDFSVHWRPAADAGWTVAVLQSSQIFAPHAHHWRDRECAREVQEHYAHLARELAIDGRHAALAGFSQGAALVIWLTLAGRIQANAVIAVAPAIRSPEEFAGLTGHHVGPAFRIYIIVGDQDWCYEPARDLRGVIQGHGLPAEMEVHPGLGHSMPGEFSPSLVRGLSFVAVA